MNHEVALGQKTVLALTAKLNGHHNHIYFDNYFNSSLLHEKLLRRGLYSCGTVKSFLKNLLPQMSAKTQKRGEPQVPKLKLKPGKSKIWQCTKDNGLILAIIWQEKAKRKPVRILSSNVNPIAPLTSVQRTQRDGTKKDVPCPLAVELYNKYMKLIEVISCIPCIPLRDDPKNGGLIYSGFWLMFQFQMP